MSRMARLTRPADRRRQDDAGYGGVGKERMTYLEAEIYLPNLGGSEEWRRRMERMGRGFVSSAWHFMKPARLLEIRGEVGYSFFQHPHESMQKYPNVRLHR